MSKNMTPCEMLGYKVGDEFEVISHHAFKKGQVVTLHEDDGTECPLFSGDGGGAGVFDGVECSFATLNKQVRKIANKLKPAKQALADAIHQNGWRVEGGDWHKNGELPPVGEVCLYAVSERLSVEVEITAHAKLGICFVQVGQSGESYVSKVAELHRFRPLRTEREKAIDEMVSLVEPLATYMEFAGAIYDAGMYKEVK
jgi:hypothetical protein